MAKVTTVIDQAKCSGCGLCVSVCPADTLAVKDGVATVVGAHSLNCDHCAAVCPENAIVVEGVAPEATALRAIDPEKSPALKSFFDLCLNRRSCRNYNDRPIEPELLADLTRIGVTAPSGTNSQKWTFTVVPGRQGVARFAGAVGEFYAGLNRLARKPLARLISKLFMGGELSRYYRSYYATVEDALSRFREHGEDLLFHGATAAIVVSTKPGASCAKEDALLATQNILLAAEALGLGTCLIGFAVEAMAREPAIAGSLGIPTDETCHAVIALGHPQISYQRPAARKPYDLRFAP